MISLHKRLLENGVQILPPESFSYGEPVNPLRLGYASLTEAQLEEGLKKIAQLL
jgi:GntR family transcriptional regulator/MocR family aminotransferase